MQLASSIRVFRKRQQFHERFGGVATANHTNNLHPFESDGMIRCQMLPKKLLFMEAQLGTTNQCMTAVHCITVVTDQLFATDFNTNGVSGGSAAGVCLLYGRCARRLKLLLMRFRAAMRWVTISVSASVRAAIWFCWRTRAFPSCWLTPKNLRTQSSDQRCTAGSAGPCDGFCCYGCGI